MMQKSLLLSVLTILTCPSNSSFLMFGAVTSTFTVIVPCSGVRFIPDDGVNVQVPQSGWDSTVQLRWEFSSPVFHTWIVPVAVAPGFILSQERWPAQFKSGFGGGGGIYGPPMSWNAMSPYHEFVQY